MLNKIKKLTKGSFIRNVFLMASGTAVAQVITMLLSPLITRYYGPEAYGLMGTFTAIVTIFTPIAALTYPIAIVLPKSDNEARGIAKLSFYNTLGITILSALIILIFHNQITEIFNIETVQSFLILIPVAIFLGGLYQIIEQWLIRTKQFRISARAAVLQAIFVQGGKAGIGAFSPFAGILIFLSAINEGVKALIMLLASRKSENKLINRNQKQKVSIIKLAKDYKDFPIFRAPETFLNAVSTSLPTLMLTSFFGPAVAGFYNIGKTVLNIPSQLIGKSVGDVFYPRASEAANNRERLTPLIRKATLFMGAVGILPFGVVILFGPWLFSFVFGSDWEMAGEYARWIALWSFFGFMNRPSVRSLPVLKAQDFQLKYTILMLVVRIIALFVGYYLFKSDLMAIILYSLSGAILNLGLITITLNISRKFDKQNIEAMNNEGN
jgi:O-antigen/teichoic acid export membrane protein